MLYTLLVVVPIAYYVFSSVTRFRANLLAAKSSGLPCVVAPVFGYDRVWNVVEPLLFPIIRRLPASLRDPWSMVVGVNYGWEFRFAPFSKVGTTFIIVTPVKNIIATADADVITQITSRRNDFPKPIELYDILEIYGQNLLTVEGKAWRKHRRITAPPFTEQNNRLVWKESIFQACQMLQSWKAKTETEEKDRNGHTNGVVQGKPIEVSDGKKSTMGAVVDSLAKDSMRMTLHIISRVGFDVRCVWPGMKDDTTNGKDVIKSGEVPEGHQMSYVDALQTLLRFILVALLVPDWLMRIAPIAILQKTKTAYLEWGKYMVEMYEKKRQQILTSKIKDDDSGLDLMGAMIRGSGQIPGTPNYGKGPEAGLSKQEIIGDSFLLFIAGHETTANTIHFTILYLAMHPDIQRKLQAELDAIFGSRISKPEDWNYDEDLRQLFSGFAGAIMNEELRLIPPVIVIPKCTLPNSPQTLMVDGKEHTVPADTYIAMNAGAVHRNPKYWPHGPARAAKDGGPIHPLSNPDNDMEEFKPERWILDTSDGEARQENKSAEVERGPEKKPEGDEFGINVTPDTAASMFRPPRGAYIPFSDGYRACLGRRFAQVEILALLAVIFSTHSVELDTNSFVGEEEVLKMDKEERMTIWRMAKNEAERKLKDELAALLTLQLRGKGIKVRVCERGKELFG